MVMILLASACGGSDGSDPTDPGPDAPTPTHLVVEVVGAQVAGVPFDVTVTLADAEGRAVSATASSTLVLEVGAGEGTLGGVVTAQLEQGASAAAFADITYDLAQSGVRLAASASGGSASGLSGVSDPFDLAFDADGPLIAFRRTTDTHQDIYLTTPDGSAYVNLSSDPTVASDPAWSPDGSRLAFVSMRTGSSEVFLIDADGTGLVQLTDDPGRARWPSWSPDGAWIAYSSDSDGQRDLYAVPVGAAASVAGAQAPECRLTNTATTDDEPLWLPDGNVIFFSNRDGHGALYRFEFDCTGFAEPTKITIDQVFSCSPGKGGVLLDDRVIVTHVSDQAGSNDIWMMDSDGSNRSNLTNHPASDWASSLASPWPGTASGSPGAWWAPPATAAQLMTLPPVIFDSDRDGSWNLHVIAADGTDAMRVTHHPGDDEFPAWRPPPPSGAGAAVRIGSGRVGPDAWASLDDHRQSGVRWASRFDRGVQVVSDGGCRAR